MGRSVRYLKTNLLPLLTEAAEKCSEYGSVRFSDLLSNAVKFTRSGTITLNTRYRDGTFSLSV